MCSVRQLYFSYLVNGEILSSRCEELALFDPFKQNFNLVGIWLKISNFEVRENLYGESPPPPPLGQRTDGRTDTTEEMVTVRLFFRHLRQRAQWILPDCVFPHTVYFASPAAGFRSVASSSLMRILNIIRRNFML
jgi:hypothetical protein